MAHRLEMFGIGGIRMGTTHICMRENLNITNNLRSNSPKMVSLGINHVYSIIYLVIVT